MMILGTVKRHPDGFGFLIPDDKNHEDVYIPKHSMEGIMTNDKVYAKVSKAKDGRFSGEIVRIDKRATDKIFGIFRSRSETEGYLEDKENHWGETLKLTPQSIKGIKPGSMVYAKITSYPGDPRGFRGEVIETIGDLQDPMNDIRRAILMHGIPEGFSRKTMMEVSKLEPTVDPEDTKHRKDLRSLSLITIDGVTAKDFDDAIYVETTEQGFHLWVAIADVSHYVKLGTALNEDAYAKGNSSYFPRFVEPMLPEILSNELCSLRPNVDRLCMVCEMWMDFSGTVTKTEIYEGVMNSKARVTYGEAQEVIDGTGPEKLNHVKDVILRASDLAKILLAKRNREGSLNLEVPETEMVIDELGNPIDIIRSERIFAHQLIEEMMLAANVAVAKFLHSKEVPSISRTHDNPDQEKIMLLQGFLASFGSDMTISGGALQKKLTKILQKFEHTPEGLILNRLVLRSMKQASYTVEEKGHFGLGFQYYTHFTSPIRRYPDLIVHRLLKCFIPTHHKYTLPSEDDLRSAATHCSATEQRSVKAERFLAGVKRARFIQKFIGQEFEGIVTSVAKFGVFVSLRSYDVDGLIRMDDLGKDHFEYDEQQMQLIGKRSGFRYFLGMPLQVIVSNVNVELGQIDFLLAKEVEKNEGQIKGDRKHATSEKKSNWKHDKKRKKTEKDRKRVRKSRVSKSSGKNKSR
jgi:ribonuclease R